MRFVSLGVILVGLAAGCGDGVPVAATGEAPAAVPVSRDAWWSAATTLASGRERILSPRELRSLLAIGRERGFDADADWWERRRAWAFLRILSLDAEDVEANAATGRRTLQSIEGFVEIWDEMLRTRVPTPVIAELLDRYGDWIFEGRPIFLTAEEFAIESARFSQAAKHLGRLREDPAYAALHGALRKVRTSFHADYRFVHVQTGPFVVFYAARDLQRDPEGDEVAEEARLAERREYYRRRLATWTAVYGEVLADISNLYPELWRKHAPPPGAAFCQWIFSERGWYADFMARIRRGSGEAPYRFGFVETATAWAYMVEPTDEEVDLGEGGKRPEADPMGLRETAAYLAARQLLRYWAKNTEDPTVNNMDRSAAYWLKDGWPSYLAGRRIGRPRVGRLLSQMKHEEWQFPSMQSVVDRRGRLDLVGLIRPPESGTETAPPPDFGFSDVAWLLVKSLNDDKRRAAFERFLISQIEGTRHGLEWFEECFDVNGDAAWRSLQSAVYARIERE